MNLLHTKKFRYGSVSLALTVAIIAAVILVNAIFTALSNKFLWYIDMTSEQIYTLTDDAKTILDGMNTDHEVDIVLCSEKDVLEANSAQRFVLYTVLDIADRYDNVNVKYVDVHTNPSAVNPYKAQTNQDINSQSVIVASGSECRVFSLESLFTYDSTSSTILGYNGEQRLVSAMLSVTQTEVPLACVTINHSERENKNFEYVTQTLEDAGYRVEALDLADDDVDPECRLMVIFDPQDDFLAKDEFGKTSELTKLERFLGGDNALMVFFDHETEELVEFEAFLREWGIGIARKDLSNVLVSDPKSAYDKDGYTTVAKYVENGLGSSLTKQLRSKKNPKPVVFGNVSPLVNTYDVSYNADEDTWIGTYSVNGLSRISYDIFTSSGAAKAMAGGAELSKEELESMDLYTPAEESVFSYMRLTSETVVDESNGMHNSYVLACGSTDFAYGLSNTQYGNHTMLTYACSIIGRSEVSVSLDVKYFSDSEISNITAKEANQYTIVLTVVPAAIIFVVGVYIMVRRKYA